MSTRQPARKLDALAPTSNFPPYAGNVKEKHLPVALFDTLFLHRTRHLSTGCAQMGNGFGLRRIRVRVQSLSTRSNYENNYENSSRSLPLVRGLRMETRSGRAGGRRHTL